MVHSGLELAVICNHLHESSLGDCVKMWRWTSHGSTPLSPAAVQLQYYSRAEKEAQGGTKKAQGCSLMSHLCQYGCYLFMPFLERRATPSLPWRGEQLHKHNEKSPLAPYITSPCITPGEPMHVSPQTPV